MLEAKQAKLTREYLNHVIKRKKNNLVSAADISIKTVEDGLFKPNHVRPGFLKILNRLKKETVEQGLEASQREKDLTNLLERGVKQKIITSQEKSSHLYEWEHVIHPWFTTASKKMVKNLMAIKDR